ncbi:MAG: LCP family protein [Chloroflexales bacterium]|nr:LCP family protein [Chloroflexales bacterium]
MPFLKRRLIRGVLLIGGLLSIALFLQLALEWRQALDDIDAMIVDSVTLPSPNVGMTHSDPSSTIQDLIAVPSAQPSASADLPSNPAKSTPALTDALPSHEQVLAPEREDSTQPVPDQIHILLLGTDARPTDDEPTRTDAMILVRLDRTKGRASMLSLPRDLWVPYANDSGSGRINAAYGLGERTFGPGGGGALAEATVGQLLGFKIDYFVMVNFQGFEHFIDRLGGITIDVPEAIHDPDYPTDDYRTIEVRFRKGVQRMDSERALMYVRTRHADSDFGRNQRQQLVLMAIFDEVRKQGLLQQLTSLDDYTGALRDYVRTDIPRWMMIEIANWGRGLDLADVRRYAIDSSAIVDLKPPATFAVKQRELTRIVGQFTGESVSSAGGK